MHGAAAQVIWSVAAPLIVLFMTYIAVQVRRGAKRIITEHRWLMKTVENQQADIERILKVMESNRKPTAARRRE